MEMLYMVPILFIIFNRPGTTQQVFNEIRKARPAQLFVAADGPRKNRPDEQEDCRKAREIINQVDWECRVSTLFRDENLGCKNGVSSAIDWFFSHVEEGIILEDDCVPDESFFQFCQELLERYRDDERIMMISGNNFDSEMRSGHSYYFSRYIHAWGWATWRRAWQKFDLTMKQWPVVRNSLWLVDILEEHEAIDYWNRIFQYTYSGGIDTWDYQWVFSCWLQNGLVITPQTNLVANIGFHQFATHTKDPDSSPQLKVASMVFPLQHPQVVSRNLAADLTHQKKYFKDISLYKKIKSKWGQLFSNKSS